MPFGIGSGAGVIFGVTGGVTEAVSGAFVKDITVWKWIRSNSVEFVEKKD